MLERKTGTYKREHPAPPGFEDQLLRRSMKALPLVVDKALENLPQEQSEAARGGYRNLGCHGNLYDLMIPIVERW